MSGPREEDRDPLARRARRLLRWYPRGWRDRYGDEFAELLRAEMAEQPRSWRRTLDVARSGLFARCTATGLTSHELPPADQFRACIGTLGCAVAVTGALGMFMLAQLATGWQWTVARSGPAAVGTLIMAAAAGCAALTGLAAAVPAGWHAARSASRRRDARLAAALALAILSAVVLVVGARHFQNGWPGTGGTGAERHLVPAGLAAFGWAATLSVSAYWAHPGLWGTFPVTELGWMVLSPLAWAGVLAGAASTARRIELPDPIRTYLSWLSVAATVAAVLFVTGAGCWVLASVPAEAGAFRPGVIDGGGLAVMAGCAVVALRAAVAVRRARLRLADPA